jgi:hypothetical protein
MRPKLGREFRQAQELEKEGPERRVHLEQMKILEGLIPEEHSHTMEGVLYYRVSKL